MTMHAQTPATAEDFAAIYARFSSSLGYAQLPKAVLDAARTNIHDTLACSIAGYRAPGVQEVLDIVRDWGGKPQAQVLWSDLSVPAPNAAWINGIMAHACDYDDTHDKAILHAGISLLPAAIAAAGIAGRPVSGQEFCVDVVCGLELICRIGVADMQGTHALFNRDHFFKWHPLVRPTNQFATIQYIDAWYQYMTTAPWLSGVIVPGVVSGTFPNYTLAAATPYSAD